MRATYIVKRVANQWSVFVLGKLVHEGTKKECQELADDNN